MLRDSAYAQGLTHGKKAREEIRHNLKVYFRRFKNETELSRNEVFKRASKYLPVIKKTSPVYAEAMRGVADGAGSDMLEITALNVRYELMYSQFAKIGVKPIPRTDGCTAFAAEPDMVGNGHVMMGQNWDWIPEVKGIFLKNLNEDGPAVFCFTEAGVVGGKIGLNSEGLGLMINGLVSSQDDWSRLTKPFHVRCWEVLRSKTLQQAISILTRGERPCSANFLLGQQSPKEPGRIVDLECAPLAQCELHPEKGVIAHANHFIDPDSLGVKQILDDERLSTLHRFERIQALLGENVGPSNRLTLRTAEEMLRDHDGKPDSVCRHANPAFPQDDRYETVVSVVMDLGEKKLWATLGSPCQNEYLAFKL